MFQINLLFLFLLCQAVKFCRDVASAARSFQVFAVSVDPWLEGWVLVLHVFAEGFAPSLTKLADMACVCVLQSTVVRLPLFPVLGIFFIYRFLFLLCSPFHAFSLFATFALVSHHVVIEFTHLPWPLFRSLTTLELGSFGKYGRPEAASLCYLLVLLLLPEFFLRLALLDLFEATVVKLDVLVRPLSALGI